MKPLFDRELIPRIEAKPNEYNLNGRGDATKDMVLIMMFGKLLEFKAFTERLTESYKEAGIEVPANDKFYRFFLGWYRMRYMKLSFEKRALTEQGTLSETEGKATLSYPGNLEDNVYVGVAAIPKIALRYGSALMQSEGCQSPDLDSKSNHYYLFSNPCELVPVQNDIRETVDIFGYKSIDGGIEGSIPAGNAMFFGATKFSLNQKRGEPLKPSEDYYLSIKAAHMRALNDGYQIPDGYIDSIKKIEFLTT